MIKFYDTMSGKKKTFKPLSSDNKTVKIYSCGPTVYSRAHIGNLRAYIFTDILKRTLKHFGYKINDIVNITDVGHLVSDDDHGEDKMHKAAKREGKDPYEIAKQYEKLYLEDMEKLNVIPAKKFPRATEHIKEQLKLIDKLDKNGFTYKTSDGIYFDTSKLKSYGELGGQKLDEKEAGARVKKNSEKKNPQDFALWKFTTGDNKNHIMKWKSKYGEGFPGWHLECSAMGYKYLGKEIDIHTGGIDHISIHHENEIAQNKGAKTITKVNFWMHNQFILVNDEKMSKSLGNDYNLQQLVSKDYSPLAFRAICLKSHYRKQMNFTFDSLEEGELIVSKIDSFMTALKEINPSRDNHVNLQKIANDYLKKFNNALEDDLNTSVALSAVLEFMKDTYNKPTLDKPDIKAAKEFMLKTDKVLGLIEKKEREVIPKKVRDLIKERKTARKNNDYETSDKLRDEIGKLGYIIKDDKSTKKGYILTKK